MRNITLKPTFSETDHKSNYNVINQHIDDDYYIIDYYPEDFVLSGNAATGSVAATVISVAAGNERIAVVSMQEGMISEFKWNLRSRVYWETGTIETIVYYTGSISSPNNIRFSLTGMKHALNEDISAVGTGSITANEVTPGPATLLTLKKYTFSTYQTFSREYELLNYRLLRSAGDADDTYTGDAYVVMIRQRLIPSNIQSGLAGTA